MEPAQTRALTWVRKHFKRGLSIFAGLVLALASGFVIVNSFITDASTDGVSAVKSDIRTLCTGCIMFQLETGQFPGDDNWIEALTTHTDKHKQHMEKIPKDPWGNEYQYRLVGRQQQDIPDLWSMGPDEISGTEDDVTNWVIDTQRLAGANR